MDCEICKRIKLIEEKQNPTLVCELETGYVVLGDYQRFFGYTLFLCNRHVRELHELEPHFLNQHLIEMAIVQEAVCLIFKAEKMNVELLGNGDAHVHWHIFPRVKGDMPISGPVWWVGKEEMYDDQFLINYKKMIPYQKKLKLEIENLRQKYKI